MWELTGYVVYTGGTSTGTAMDGLYVGGSYAPGLESTSFTVLGTVTSVGLYGGGFGGGRGGPGGQRP